MFFDKDIWDTFCSPRKRKPKTKIEAWVYLYGLCEANNNIIEISYSELAKQLLWSRVEVLRFLKKLKELGKIELTSTTKCTIIRIVSIEPTQQEQVSEVDTICTAIETQTKKAILFQETPYFYDKNRFIQDFTNRFPEYADYDLDYYHKAAQNWGQGSSINKYKKKDWVLTIKTWIDNDEKRGKAVKKKPNIPIILMQTQNSLHKALEYVKNNPL